MSYSDLPFVSTKYDKHICDPCCNCPFSTNTSDQTKDEDKRLKNWSEWMRERRQVQKRLGEPLNRNADELLMNDHEELRGMIEDRLVIQYTNIPKTFDKYRGNPAFWKLPVPLNCCYDAEPTHFSVMNQQERNKIPNIEYVKVPDFIKTEKEAHSKRCYHTWTKSSYLQKRMEDCRELIDNIEPHKPILKELIVVGKALKPKPCGDLEIIESTVQKKSEDSYKISQSFLTINDIPIYANTKDLKRIRLVQDYNIKSNSVKTIYLLLHNMTNMCLRFYFINYEPKLIFQDIIPKQLQTNQVFFYDKNEHMIQPGEKLNFPFWFNCKICGPYSNTLELKCIPDLWENQLQIIVAFQTNAVIGNYNEGCIEISQRLDNQVRNSIIKDVLYGIYKKIPPKIAKVDVYTYDKATIFESVNSIYDPLHFRPKYLYDKLIVGELELFYESVKLENHPDIWDYKLDSLRVITKDRENYEQELELQTNLETVSKKIDEHKEERAKLAEKALSFWTVKETDKIDKTKKSKKNNKTASNKSEKESKKPGKDKESKKSDKSDKKGKDKGPVAIIIVEPVRQEIPKTLSDKLEEIIMKLRTPSSWYLEHQRKLTYVYTILCCYIDKISEEVESMEKRMCVDRLHPKIRKQMHIDLIRIYDEKADESFMQSPRLLDLSDSPTDERAPEWSESIPLDEYEKRYNAYHGLTDVSKTGKKDKQKGSKVGSSTSKASKKSKTPKKENLNKKTNDIIKPTETIGPVETLTTVDEESTPDEEIEIPLEYLEHYNNSIYIIFYMNLQKAIDDITSIFEIQPKPILSPETVQKISETHKETPKVNSNVCVRVFDLKRAISDILQQDSVGIDRDKYNIRPPPEPPALTKSEVSMWSILDSYKHRATTIKPKQDGDIYTIVTKPFPVETCDADTSVTPEEVITERLTQTNVSALRGTITAIDEHINDETLASCNCGEEESKSEIEMSYYNSNINFDAVSSHSSISICKGFETRK